MKLVKSINIGIILQIIAVSILGVSVAVAQNQDVVYDDQIAKQWIVDTWPCSSGESPLYDLEQTKVVHGGSYAIEVNHSCSLGWDAFVLDRRTDPWAVIYYMYPNQYRGLSFWFNPGPSLDNVDTLSILTDNYQTVKLTDYIEGEVSPDTWYYINIPFADLNEENRFFRITFWNASSGNIHYYLDDISLEWVDDPNPPVISNVAVTDITWQGATITWQTDEYTISTLGYGVGGITSFIEEEDYSKEHEVVLENLSPNTTYQLNILSKDPQADPSHPQNTAEYSGEFTTAPPDTWPPVISNVYTTDVKSSRATVCWTTDEPADSRVYYGEHNYSNEKTDDTLTTSHNVVITGLTLETRYQYRVASQDVSGNLGEHQEDPPMTFTTTGYSTATLSVDAATKVRSFSANIRGCNLGNWIFFWGRPYPNDSPKLRELTKLIKPGILRYAGGLWSNNVTWDRNNTQYYPAQWADTDGDGSFETWCTRGRYDPNDAFVLDDHLRVGYDRCSGPDPIVVENAYRQGYQADEIDSFAAFANYVGADVMIEVDITTCDPDLWADMVNYTNVEHDYNFKYWELGNELDLENVDGTPDVPVGTEYVSRYKKYYQALKAVDESILIVGPTTAAHEDDSFFKAFTDFIDPLTLDTEIQKNHMLDVFSYHHYPLWNHVGGEVSYEDMFAYTYEPERRSREHINKCAADKRELLDSRGFSNTPIAITEFNSIAADLLTTYTFNHANALYMADTLARQAYSGADMVVHWELYDSPTTTSYGLIDHNNSSIVLDATTGETTLEDNFAPMPVYYTYFMYAQLFGDMLVQSSSSIEDKLSIWASADSAEPNTLKLMVVNLDYDAIEATLNLNGFNPVSGKYYELTNPDFVAAVDKTTVIDGTYLNGLEIDSSSAQSIIDSAQAIINSARSISDLGDSFSHVFPAYTATIIVLDSQIKDEAVISLSYSALNFGASVTGQATSDQTFTITNTGVGTLNWSVSDDANWLSCSPASGTGDAVITVSIDPTGLAAADFSAAATYTGTITVTDPNASNSPQTVNVTLTVYSSGTIQPPFGYFDTPIDGTTGITGAIPVTGWALDDIEVTLLEIKRDAHPSDSPAAIGRDGLVYIGYAVFVEGPRPDIEQAYPGYPFNYKAGWGYMLLTNFLPNQGNGTFRIHAIAYDKDGHTFKLGIKTITCDNANAILPFGTIDTPGQGGEASGNVFLNWGWVLTPQPNSIPTDGSTILVWVDGVAVGNIDEYNLSRPDITALFPEYANTDGAVGYYRLDTTSYSNGVYTLAWSAVDSGGNTQGIGSRYFTIINTQAAAQAGMMSRRVDFGAPLSFEVVGNLPLSFELVRVRRGYTRDVEPEVIATDNYGGVSIEIREVERVEVELGDGVDKGYMVVGNQLRPLPIGSTLDTESGTFSWQPGPGFIGEYDLVFLMQAESGLMRRIRTRIRILPKFNLR